MVALVIHYFFGIFQWRFLQKFNDKFRVKILHEMLWRFLQGREGMPLSVGASVRG